MAVKVEIDVGLLKSEIWKTYASVWPEPEMQFTLPTFRAWAEDLGYPDELARQVGRPCGLPGDRMVLAAISRVLPRPDRRSLLPKPETLRLASGNWSGPAPAAAG